MTRNLNRCLTTVKSLSSADTPLGINPRRLFTTNFNSLYDSTADSDSDSDPETTSPDFATAFASQRFFFSSPGSSNSIIDSSLASTSFSTSSNLPENPSIFGGSIAVPTYSPDPFMDFRRSMQEMVDARDLHDVDENWEYLHELLMCYLSLNPKSMHKFIVGAFADLIVSLLKALPQKGRRRKHFSKGKCNISRRQ